MNTDTNQLTQFAIAEVLGTYGRSKPSGKRNHPLQILLTEKEKKEAKKFCDKNNITLGDLYRTGAALLMDGGKELMSDEDAQKLEKRADEVIARMDKTNKRLEKILNDERINALIDKAYK